jgi:hypothetical protein
MRLRKHAAALALCCAATAYAQNPDTRPPENPKPPDASREVRVTERRDEPEKPVLPPQTEEQRVVELYQAQLGGQLTNATYLGVSTSEVPAALRQHLGLPEGVGLVVDFVEDDSPAKSAGVKQYDILKKLDEQILVNAQQLAVLIRSHKSGEEIKLTLVRGGKEQTLTAKLVERPGKPLGDMFPLDQPNAEWQRWARRSVAVPTPTRPPRQNRNNTGSGNRTVSVWRDNDTTITITQGEDSKRHLTVSDKSGKKVFEGDLDNKEDRARMPPDVAEKVRQMEAKIRPDGNNKPNGELRGAVDVGAGNFELSVEGAFDFKGEQEVQVEEHQDADSDGEPGPSAKRPIRDNDVLNIAIAGVHGPGVKTVKLARVRDGRVQLPYVAPVKCVGLTDAELEKKVATLYTEAKIAPKVAVRVRNVGPVEQRAAKDEPK